MAHFGIISPPVSGHLNPFGALGRELRRRGHRVTVFQMADLEAKALAEELEFWPIGQTDHPLGSLPEWLAGMSRLSGLNGLRFTIQAIVRSTRMFCRDGPDAVKAARIDLLLVDQTEPAGAAIAEFCRLPYVTLCMALALNREPGIPPPFADSGYSLRPLDLIRNRLGYAAWDFFTRPVLRVVNEFRRGWNFPLYRRGDETMSSLAQISQQTAAFDFPRKALPDCFHYVGPLRFPRRQSRDFPWEKIGKEPVIYASLGSLHGGKEHIFRVIANACQDLPFQLVLSHGGALSDAETAGWPGRPVIVSYAPQEELLPRAQIAITHAGLNTVLDSLSAGVPIVAVPITAEQPGIAARVRWCGVGEVLSLRSLREESLRRSVRRVLDVPLYRSKAGTLAKSIQQAGGVGRAGDIIEAVLRNRAPCSS